MFPAGRNGSAIPIPLSNDPVVLAGKLWGAARSHVSAL
jgi:hypothetical protein